MNPAAAASPGRIGLTAALLASLAALVLVTPADGGPSAWNAYLAPAGACPGDTSASAPAALQRRAVACLINHARRQSRRAKLAKSSSLARAAELKGEKVAACGDFSHTPCGSSLIGPLRASGYPYASFGENLYVGPMGGVTPRDVVAAWMNSPPHRANILKPYFREVGAMLVPAQGIVNAGPEVVWVATFGSRR